MYLTLCSLLHVFLWISHESQNYCNPSNTNKKLFIVTTVSGFVGHYWEKTLSLMFLVISLSIINAINLRISFCKSLCKYLLRFFSIQLVILGSIFDLSFISWSKFPWSSFPQNGRPCLAKTVYFEEYILPVFCFFNYKTVTHLFSNVYFIICHI